MRKAILIEEFSSDIRTVWNVVTNNLDYKWRSDLNRIEVFDDGSSFIEYTKDGFQTNFTIKEKVEFRQYEFAMENQKFTGYWTGIFSETQTGGTKIIFTETIYIRNPVIEMLSYLFMNLKKIQKTYACDLKRKLEEI